MNITCVKCTSVLDRKTVGGVDVDVCPSCGGLWLDRGEIERLSKAAATEVASLQSAPKGAPEFGDTSDRCPACHGRLRVVTLGAVQVEACARCQGLFLEKGELSGALAAIHGRTVAQLLSGAPPLPRD